MSKKKIIMVISCILVIILVISLVVFRFKNSQKEMPTDVEDYNSNEIEEESNLTTNDEIPTENQNAIITENQTEINQQTTQKEKTNTTTRTNNKETKIQTKTSQVISTPTTQEQSNRVTKDKKEKVNTPTQETPVQKTTKDEGSKYVRNDVIINKIKQIIKSNETEDMKNFGYNIVVDSSIKNSTNQFTFAESRVISSIRLKFGTIKIYAEDYYKNGNLIMTQCYIF